MSSFALHTVTTPARYRRLTYLISSFSLKGHTAVQIERYTTSIRTKQPNSTLKLRILKGCTQMYVNTCGTCPHHSGMNMCGHYVVGHICTHVRICSRTCSFSTTLCHLRCSYCACICTTLTSSAIGIRQWDHYDRCGQH